MVGKRCLLDVNQSVPVVFKPQNFANLLYQIEVLIIFLEVRVQRILAGRLRQRNEMAPNQLQKLSETIQVNKASAVQGLNHGG
jgi:hypothetical protein